ncbi:ABC transporter ATP-binding protein [Amaricoccus tamworthensis]|uniref:ABC transporter ATP-binding protein n=1 Tax=Amaricoccus tamworthensis TaxID=57002 RepID=UPI003C7B843B
MTASVDSATPRALELRNVEKVFGENAAALRGLSFDVFEGEFVSLLGPSGCGKSTALRLIAGLIQPTSGTIKRRFGKSELAVVFQEPTLMPWTTVEKNVWLPLKLRGMSFGEAKPVVDEALRLVGLEGFRGAWPRELSGGMKMRVSIARALVTRPKLILMDEPFAALDEITRFRLNDDLLSLKSKLGCTVVFVTHSVFESVYLSDRILTMGTAPGRVVEETVIDTERSRDETFRTSAEYAGWCRNVSESLRRGIGAAV